MKSQTSFLLLILFIIQMQIVYSQTNTKTWAETTVQDFFDNQLNNLIVTNNSGGEVQIPQPLIKTIGDYKNSSVYRFIAKDSAGNFVRTWVQGGNVFLKKYAADGKEITNFLKVNEENGSEGGVGSRVALFNDGTYMVVWSVTSNLNSNVFGQIVYNDSIKAGKNFKINDTVDYGTHRPVIFANEADQLFWIFYLLPKGINSGGFHNYKIYVQKRDKSGNKIGETFLLNKDNLASIELSPSIAGNSDGFWVTWTGLNGVSSWDEDVYLRHFNYDGSPISRAEMVNDNLTKMQADADVALDDNSNVFVVWVDERDTKPTQLNGCFYIYGQFFDKSGNRVGNNIRLSDTTFLFNESPDIECKDNEFQLSYLSRPDTYGSYLTFVNRWKYDPKFFGEMVSSVFNASPSGANFEKIYWQVTSVPQTEIKFQLRSGKTLEQLNNASWYGPLSSSNYYTLNGGTTINTIHNGDYLIQYKAFFTSQNGNTSVLKSASIDYSTFDNTPPSSPTNLSAASSYGSIILNWNLNSENDLLHYFVYRRGAAGAYTDQTRFSVPKEKNSFRDTSVIARTVYFYVVTAVDSSHNESSYSNEVSSKSYGINIYVSSNGNSNGDGSIANPFKTIQQGMNAALEGDTVRVLSGIYDESFSMKRGVSLIGTSAAECKINSEVSAADSCIIKSLTFSKTITCNNVSPVITENIFSGNNAFQESAIKVEFFASPFITKNFINEFQRGINVQTYSNPTIKNNIICVNEYGILIGEYENPTIINNTLFAKNGGTLQVYSNLAVTVENNIVMGLSKDLSPVAIAQWSSTSKIRYNLFWNPYNIAWSVPANSLFLDPQFVNIELQDFHLLSSSPAVNAGNPDAVYNDIDGSINDMGAYGGPDPVNPLLLSQFIKSIIASSESTYPGDTVTAYIKLDNAAGLAKASFNLEYDDGLLSFLNAELTDATQDFSLEARIVSAKEISLLLSSANPIQSGSEEILKLNFLVSNNSNGNDASSLILKNILLFDINQKEIKIRSITNGTVVINFLPESDKHIYVDSGNEGIQNGSRQYPFNTIMDAVNIANAGDTIFVSGGDYFGTVFMKEGIHLIGSGASVTKLLVTGEQTAVIFSNIKEAEFSGFTIQADESYYSLRSTLTIESSSPVIRKNKFEAPLLHEIAINILESSSAMFENNYLKNAGIYVHSSNPIITNNVIEVVYTSAISCSKNASPTISKNIIEGPPFSGGISIEDAHPIVKNNIIYINEAGRGIVLYNSNNSEIYNNIIKDKSALGIGIDIINSSNSKIINNLIFNSGKGINEENSISTVFNNIVMNNNIFGMQLSPTSQYNFNDVWNNSVNYLEINPGSNDISYNPLFVDTTKGDYRLLPNSPCINAGNFNVQYNDPDGTRNDIGVYGGPYADATWNFTNETSLAMDPLTVLATDTVQLIISGKNLKGITEFDFTISYDPSLFKIINATTGNITKGFSIERKNIDAGYTNLCLKSIKGINNEDSEIVRLSLAVHAVKDVSSYFRIESAKVKDETTYEKNIFNLKDGIIRIIITDINDNKNAIPFSFVLFQNFPNPFNPTTNIRYDLPKESEVQLAIYNVLGQKVAELVHAYQKAGRYEVEWNAEKFASGIYFCSMRAKGFSDTKKFILLK
jgi:parallel beta-helix repeat protein